MTDFGKTRFFTPEKGIEQGGKESPLIWKMVYDVLLTILNESTLGYELKTKQRNTKIPYIAFVDDISLISDSRQDMQSLLQLTSETLKKMQIEINPKKTAVHMNKLAREKASPNITFSCYGEDMSVTAQNNGMADMKLLGVYVNIDGHSKSVIQKLSQTVEQFVAKCEKKMLNDALLRYLHNSVLIPILLHQNLALQATPSQLKALMIPPRGLIRRRTFKYNSIRNEMIHQAQLMGFKNLETEVVTTSIEACFKIKRCNNISKEVWNIMEEKLSVNLDGNALQNPAQFLALPDTRRDTLVAIIARNMTEMQVKFEGEDLTRYLGKILPAEPKSQLRLLRDHGLNTIDDIWNKEARRAPDTVPGNIKTKKWFAGILQKVRNYKITPREPPVLETLELQGLQTVQIWTDGSLRDPEMAGAFIIANNEQEILQTSSFRVTQGSVSSSTPERWAVINALRAVPREIQIHLFTDSQVVIDNIREAEKPHWIFQSDPVKNALFTEVRKRAKMVKVTKVKSHSGILLNEEADKLAKEALNKPAEEKYNLLDKKDLIVDSNQEKALPLRRLLKEKQKEQEWSELQKSESLKPLILSLEATTAEIRKAVFDSLLYKKESGSLYRFHDALRRFNIRRITGNLPTRQKISSWYPSESPACLRCGMSETLEYLFQCGEAYEIIERTANELQVLDVLLESEKIRKFMSTGAIPSLLLKKSNETLRSAITLMFERAFHIWIEGTTY